MEPDYKLITENFKKFINEEYQYDDEFGNDHPNLNIEKVKDFIEKHGIKIISDYYNGGFDGEMKDGTNVFLGIFTGEEGRWDNIPDYIKITPKDKNDHRGAKLDMRPISQE